MDGVFLFHWNKGINHAALILWSLHCRTLNLLPMGCCIPKPVKQGDVILLRHEMNVSHEK